jgi:DNA-binding NarL/FixJ family response regulator
MRFRQSKNPRDFLTSRDLELIQLMTEEGLDDAAIATAMGLKNPHSVKQRRRHIYDRIGGYLGYPYDAHMNKVDLALFAVTHDLVDMRTIIDRYSPVERTAHTVSA